MVFSFVCCSLGLRRGPRMGLRRSEWRHMSSSRTLQSRSLPCFFPLNQSLVPQLGSQHIHEMLPPNPCGRVTVALPSRRLFIIILMLPRASKQTGRLQHATCHKAGVVAGGRCRVPSVRLKEGPALRSALPHSEKGVTLLVSGCSLLTGVSAVLQNPSHSFPARAAYLSSARLL